MLLTSVILVLQEILEASLIISVLLAFSSQQRIPRYWITTGLGLGIVVAGIYTARLRLVSTWFDDTGVEIVNAAIQFGVVAGLTALAVSLASAVPATRSRYWQGLMVLIVALAIAREGFEILLYLSGFRAAQDLWPPVALGTLLGAGIGVSISALLYYGLVSIPPVAGQWLVRLLLALFAGNMASQAVLLLIQADRLPGGAPLWDTRHWLSEHSLTGQLLYALLGYEATPSPWQVGTYLLVFLLLMGLCARHPPSATRDP